MKKEIVIQVNFKYLRKMEIEIVEVPNPEEIARYDKFIIPTLYSK